VWIVPFTRVVGVDITHPPKEQVDKEDIHETPGRPEDASLFGLRGCVLQSRRNGILTQPTTGMRK